MIVAETAADGSDESRLQATEYRLLRSVGLLAGDAAPLALLRDAHGQMGNQANG